jgi:hypothetical protein
MAFAAIDILGVVAAPLLPATGGIDGLTVDAGPRRLGFLGGTNLCAEQVVDTVVPPLVVASDGAFWRETLGQVTAPASGAGTAVSIMSEPGMLLYGNTLNLWSG